MGKAPAFMLYAGDWLSSKKITLMKPEQEGAYIRLLCYAWNEPDCGLPDDDEQLAVLSRLGEGWLQGGGSVVKDCFFEKDGRLYNERLLEERKKQEEWRKKSSEGGKMSAKVRWGKGKKVDKGGYKKVTRVVSPKGNLSSSFSSSISSKEKKNKKKVLSNYFDSFWNLYPGTKTAKKKCKEKWLGIYPDRKLFNEIMTAIREQILWRKNAKPKDFRPPWKNPLTWLNQECWTDETGQYVKPPANYKDHKCEGCGKMFKLNIDEDENMCPHCFVFIVKKLPSKPDPKVKTFIADVANSIGGME